MEAQTQSKQTGKSALHNQQGMSLVEIIVGGAIFAILLLIIILSIQGIFNRYSRVKARQAIYPLADELKVALALDLKNYFTIPGRPNPPCSGNGQALPLNHSLSLPSGIDLKLLTKADMLALPPAADFAAYTQALLYCQDMALSDPSQLPFPPAEISKNTPPLNGKIFNPPALSFDEYTQFDFCAKIECRATDAGATYNRICPYASSNDFPVLALFHYVIRAVHNGQAYSCNDTKAGWPVDAVGEVNYLYLWSMPNPKGREYFMDTGTYHGNRSK